MTSCWWGRLRGVKEKCTQDDSRDLCLDAWMADGTMVNRGNMVSRGCSGTGRENR